MQWRIYHTKTEVNATADCPEVIRAIFSPKFGGGNVTKSNKEFLAEMLVLSKN